MPYIEVSGTNRAGCRKCHNKILKQTYRVGVAVGGYGFSNTHYYHLHCYPKASGIRHPAISSELSGYSRLPKEDKRKFRKAIWPNLVNAKNKPRIKLKKEFNKMTVKDLKYELERRDLKRNGRKQELKDRLEKFLNSKECKECNSLLVFGYCKESETDYKLTIPVYLQQIVEKYYPPCV